ncbi:MAG: S46 family peptidase [Bacteroidia bacterium]|nr:S46 family peptidase [Bacteroidia bacterium]
MNKSLRGVLLGLLSLIALNTFAQYSPNPGYVEGMWIPNTVASLKGEEMKKVGLEIDPATIYNDTARSLKDAIVVLNGGSCTAGAITSQGLLLTNHHCTYDEVAAISTPETDHLENGFWAGSYEEEIPLEGMTAGFLIKIENVTDRVMAGGKEKMETNMQIIAAEAEQDGKYVVDIAEAYHGLEYYLYVYQVYPDVRLAGVPPQDVGKYGYDTDNWMWPRHTSDFTLIRVYAGKDNQPAEYAEDNVPYQPKHFFPVSTDGVKEGDFSMIMGYPGSTTRYLTSYAVSNLIDQNYPDHIAMRKVSTTAIKKAMDESEENRLRLTGAYASLMNYYKYFKGASTMLKRNDIVGKRQGMEKAFQAWAEADPERKKEYGNILEDIKELYEVREDADHINQLLIYTFIYPDAASDALRFTYTNLRRLDAFMSRGTKEMQEAEIGRIKEGLGEYYDDFLRTMDKEIYMGHLETVFTGLRDEIKPELFKSVVAGTKPFPLSEKTDLTKKEKKKLKKQQKKNKAKWAAMSDLEKFLAWADTAYDRSLAGNPEVVKAFLDNPDKDKLKNDPLFMMLNDMLELYSSKAALVMQAFNSQIGDLRKTYIKGMMEMYPERSFYPDANSTTRFSYGKVQAYSAGDSITYKYFTTAKGLMEKYDPENPDFDVPEKLRNLINAGDYGSYADKDGKLNVCFLTTNDITGGNSGSPVLNGKGELIGVAFDGNWESMCGDVEVLQEVNRTIVADVRFILFLVDKYADSQNLLKEIVEGK